MDKEEISIDAAAMIAKESTAEQTRILELPKDERRSAVRELRSPGKGAGDHLQVKTPLLKLAVSLSEWTMANAGDADSSALLPFGRALTKLSPRILNGSPAHEARSGCRSRGHRGADQTAAGADVCGGDYGSRRRVVA
jgi:hypothetical protein